MNVAGQETLAASSDRLLVMMRDFWWFGCDENAWAMF
jgi:hypothetical protein